MTRMTTALSIGLAVSFSLNAVALLGAYGRPSTSPDPDLMARITRLEHELATLKTRAPSSRSASDAPHTSSSEGHQNSKAMQNTRTASPTSGASSALTPGREDALAKTIEDEVTQRLEGSFQQRLKSAMVRERHRNKRGEWEPPFDAFSQELGLTPEQDARATEIFNEAHDGVFDVLSTPREDGQSLLDDLTADLNAEGPTALQDFFRRMYTDHVPGEDRTYLEVMKDVRERTLESLRGELDADQLETLDELRLDPLRVHTGYDPTKEYVESRMEETKKGK